MNAKRDIERLKRVKLAQQLTYLYSKVRQQYTTLPKPVLSRSKGPHDI